MVKNNFFRIIIVSSSYLLSKNKIEILYENLNIKSSLFLLQKILESTLKTCSENIRPRSKVSQKFDVFSNWQGAWVVWLGGEPTN